ncbi:hypothetical protein [Streptomyces boluensis]|uniref:Lipoprotein n=1 Tax=Streptomyces boluensis TaxID=1775135 RepID=A0A964UJK4_9ACTN|nr:hypothetical protein [Streptomyces boluensis]NBE50354.1 hypothetical protein [Streptomyces boluensis]
MTGHAAPRIATLGTLAAALLLAVSAPGAAAVDQPTEPGELTLIDTPDGQVLADKDGNPLYLRDADKADTPGCTGDCAANWPAAIGYPTKAAGVTGETAQTEEKAEGTEQPQVIYETHPLYYFKNDKPNEPQGQNVKGWSLIGANGDAVKPGSGTGESVAPYGSVSQSDGASPSGAAGGGAPHSVRNAADEHPEAGPLALGSAAVAAGAGTVGLALLRRRRERGDASGPADGPS